MKSANKSALGGTLTAEGLVPYFRLNGVDMPVALDLPDKGQYASMAAPQVPLRIDGGLVYVAPGGERVADLPGPGRLMSDEEGEMHINNLKESIK